MRLYRAPVLIPGGLTALDAEGSPEIIYEQPTSEEAAALDKEYKLWRNFVSAAFVITIIIYIYPYF